MASALVSMRSASVSSAASRRSLPRRAPLRVVSAFQSQPQSPAAPAARLPTPKGVSLPNRLPQKEFIRFGFVHWAEKINSRACMLGFMGTLLVEAILQKGVLEAVGMKVGNGLGFEF